MAMHEQDGLLEDMGLDTDLDGFYSGSNTSAGMVNLQPMPTAFGSDPELGAVPVGNMESGTAASGTEGIGASLGAAAAAAAAAATAGAVGSALMSGKFSDANSVMGQAAGSMIGSLGAAAVPTSMQPVKDTAGRFLSKAQPWREFFLPLASPNSSEGCSRLTSNVYNYQTNYAILFVIWLALEVLMQPSALISIAIIAVVWMLFLKKNDDPEWQPEVGGVKLGPMQRWLCLAALTAITLLVAVGSTIFNSALMFLVFVFVHGLVHDTSAKAQGESGGVPL